MGGLSSAQLITTLPLLAAGLAGAISALASRDADTGFLYRQEHPTRISTAQVERVVRTAPDPATVPRTPGRRARCRPTTARGLRNPWRCSVSYPSGRTAEYRVLVRADGSYVGRYLGGSSTVEGCCVKLPGAE